MEPEPDRPDRRRGWWIAGPGVASVALGLVAVVVSTGATERLWILFVVALMQAGLVVWTAIALGLVRGRRPLARAAGITGIVVAALCIVQAAGLFVLMSLGSSL